ncbi:antitoxin MazE family protein [Hansschlegelia quercus]
MRARTMTGRPALKSSRERMQQLRARRRAQGMKLVQFWVPDVRSPEFLAEARRQSLAVANSPQEAEDQAFIDSLSIDPWTEENGR